MQPLFELPDQDTRPLALRAMHAAYGDAPGFTCATCRHLTRSWTGYRCGLSTRDAQLISDMWRTDYEACGRWEAGQA